ncbi:titin homolog, partial [Acanthopagrus latus]|uniref:titin homolog n=1 Tax=Acanthopagrus latus TaxID=8177 RepID=UPI00187CE018
MTSVEKRRSGRKSGGHRKHSDGGYSDTSSGGSFLDETDREVSNLTDRAFRSLCIGDEAVYNDSDLCSSSPCIPRDRQLAFSQSEQGRDREDREREELKRAAHESFSLRVQQYGQDLIHGGMYGAKIHRDPQWEVYGERTQGRVSATFQHSFMETSQQEESLREEQLSFFSNGATEVGSQQRRSRSRVSSLIRAFNSEGQRDGAGMDGKLREWNDETSWDKSALMSIQRELSEFSTPYQPNFNSGHFPSAGPFTAQDGNFYSAAVANMNSSSSFMRSSHSKHSMSAQVNCNSNFFIHSEYSPFKVWRDHNRFPFQQGEFSGFMHCSEFPKWYETPMYKELSLEAQPQGPYRFDERSIRHQRNTMAPVVPATPSRSTSTSTMMQRALSVEKRCESELAGHYPHRKRTQSLGANRLQSQRPSTASPTIEMSRRVQETISSVKALQQKIKMMTEQNISAGMTANQQGVLYSNNNSVPFGNSAPTAAPNVVSSNTSTTPFNTSQLLTPSVHAHQEAETSEVRQYAASPQPVEHPPVRAESRGATPDIRMSSYKSRATSLLFNLKDNRKRVKSTYSPPKFKGLETPEKNKQRNTQEPRDTVIDMPDFSDQDVQFTQVEAASHQNVNQYYDPGLPLTAVNSQPVTTHTGQYSDYTSSDYQTALMQGEMVHHSGFTGFIPENYPNYQLANGQNLHEDLSSFTSYKQGMLDYAETHGGDAHRLKPSYTSAETQRLNADNNQTRDYLISKANTEQHFNETAGRESTKVDRYQQLIDNKHDYSNVSSPDRWRQTNSLDTENRSLKTAISPWKQEITAFVEKDQHAQAYQRAATIKEELNFTRDRYRGENQQSINKDLEKIELRESFGVGTFSHKKAELVNPNMSNQLPQHAPFSNATVQSPPYYGQHQPGAFEDKYVPQHYGHSKENEMRDNHSTQNSNRYTDQEYGNQHCLYSDKDKTMLLRETGSTKPLPKGHERQSLQTMEAKPQIEHNKQKNSLSNPNNASAPTMGNKVERRQFAEVKAEQATAERRKAQHAQEELANAQHWAQVEQPKVESARLILAGQTGSERVKAEQAKAEVTEPDRVNQASTEHIKDKETKGEETEPPREKQSEREQTREQTATEEPRNITEEAGVRHMREGLVEQVKAEQAGAERLKEEHIKIEPAKTEQAEQAGIEEAETEQARRERIKAEQLEEEKARAAQVEREQMEAEQIRAEKVKAEQAEAEQMKEQQAKAEKDKSEVVEDISIQANQVNAEQPAKQISNAKEENVDERKAAQFGQTKLELAQAERAKTESMQERFAKPAAKLAQLVKIEPDKVEQVKTELAKAKAELAKIKEKMRGEQKEKARGTVLPREDGNKKDVPSVADANDNEEHKDQATQRDELGPANIGANEYERLREKYGFTDTTSINRNKLSAAGNTASLDTCETPALSLDKVEPPNDEKSKDKHNPTMATANTENGKEGGSFKATEVTESQYVYSETSKEFKLSGADYLHTKVDSATGDTATDDEVKDNRVENLGKRDTLKRTDVSQHRDSDMVKPLSVERKTKSGEHQVGKDPHFTPPRALTSKERAQTKQEILTSKIKAHAEKEISAIKEKGFAKRDGFISKSTTKSLAGSQNINIRQRPPSQEVPKKHESSSNITLKHQTEPSGIQSEPVKSVSTPTSATVPVKSAATASQLADHSQKQVPKEPTKSNNNEPKLPREEKRAGSYIMSTDEGLKENQKRENKSGMKSPIQNKELALKSKQGKQEANQGEMSGKQKETLKDSAAVNTDHLNKKKDNPSKAAVVGEAESSKPMTTEKAESKHGAEDSASSLNLCFAQNETPVADDNLQITGIMVTVHERKPSESNGKSNQEQINAKEKECSNSELEKCHPSSGVEVSEGNKSSKEVSIVKAGNRAVQNTLKEDQTKVSLDNHPENVQKTLGHETEQNNVSGDVSVKKTNFQQVCSSTNTRAQRETQPPTVTVTAKNKTSAETQPLLYKRDTIPGETKDYTNKMSNESSAKSVWKDEGKNDTEEKNPQNMQTAQTNGSSVAKIANTGVHSIDDSSRIHAESLKKHDPQQSVKENMSTVTNSFKSKNIDGINAPPVEEKRHDTTPPKPFKQASPSNQSTEDENLHVSLKCVDENVHIDCIAIRVVPAATKRENLKMEEKHDATTVSSDDITANEHKLDASAGINNEDRTEHLQMKDSSHHKLGKQMPESLKVSNQQNSTKVTCENTKAETEKLEKVNQSRKSVDESNIQPMETDYFQVQSVTETHKSANVPYTSDAVSKGGELPGSQSNKAAISNGSHNKGKNKVLALDQSKPAESSTGSVQDENMKRKNRETGDNLASKQGNAPTERQSNKNEKTEAGQAIHIRKQHTENQPRLSARERQSSKNPHPTGEITVKTKPEDKPKPKERASTIPEISAIADYARLKVIVSEDRANEIQEFPPNKKEGFFPLIQTRHSRRPVFTADPQDLSGKEKSFPNKTEVPSKVNKEPKPLVFPITEKEHQRTGMFKLGDKERQEKMLSDVKANDDVKERNKSPTIHLKNQRSEDQGAGADTQRLLQVDQGLHQPSSSLYAPTSSSAVNRPRNTPGSQHLKLVDNPNPCERGEDCSSKAEQLPYFDKDSHPRPTLGQMSNIEDGQQQEKLRKERLATRHEETTAKESTAKLPDKEQASGKEVKKRTEVMKIRDMLEASLAEEERRAAQREEERRAREREAIASKVKEKRQKQREEEERKAKLIEEERAAQEEKEMRAKKREEERRMKETEEKRRLKMEEERRVKLREEEERIREDEERRREKQQEEERAAHKEQQRRAAEEE